MNSVNLTIESNDFIIENSYPAAEFKYSLSNWLSLVIYFGFQFIKPSIQLLINIGDTFRDLLHLANDILSVVHEGTKKWNKTRKAEERNPSSRSYRASRLTRERGVSFLRRSYARGELSLDELDERISHAYASMTRAELDVVLRDLPSFRRWQLARRRRRIFRAYFPPFLLARAVRRLWRRRSRRWR